LAQASEYLRLGSMNSDIFSQAEEAWVFSFQGHSSSEAPGARCGCSSGGDESMAASGATGERKPPLAPGASELRRLQEEDSGISQNRSSFGRKRRGLDGGFTRRGSEHRAESQACGLYYGVALRGKSGDPLGDTHVDGSGSPPQRFPADLPITHQAQGLELPRVPGVGCGENGVVGYV